MIKPLYIPCKAGTKKPIGKDWGKNGIDAVELAKRQANNPNLIAGMILGKLTGIIDVECDSEAATAQYSELFGDIETPSWPSLRGVHHLFEYDPRLAELPSTVKFPSQLEFRIGNDGQTHSVCPPSIVDGVKREWIVSLDECHPARLPEHVVELLLLQPKDKKATERITTSSEDASAELIKRAIEYVRAADTGLTDDKKNAAFRLAGGLHSFVDESGARLTENQIVDLMQPWNMLNQPPLSSDVLREKVRNAMTYSPRPDKIIEQPVDLDELLDKPPASTFRPFPTDCFPAPVNEYIRSAAFAIGCDPSYVGTCMLPCLARAIGNKRRVRLKRKYYQPAIIWAAIVGKSGTAKTPAMNAATEFIVNRENEVQTKNEEIMQQHDEAKQRHKNDVKKWQKNLESDPETPMPKEPDEPSLERYITSDCTVEALALILSRQKDGLLVVRDELAGWLNGMGEHKKQKNGDTAKWLEMWSGGSLKQDRVSRKPVHVKRACVSVCGGIQPGILKQAIGHEHFQDGLCARLLLAMPPDRPIKWSDREIDPLVESKMSEVFNRLLSMEMADEPVSMKLTADAELIWTEYQHRHADEMKQLSDDLRAAWAKLEQYTARFALVFQCVKGGEEINADTLRAAIELSDWFGHESKRVYSMLTARDDPYGELVEWIAKQGGRVTTTQVKESGRRYRAAGAAKAALDELVRSNRGRWERVETSGRPTETFVLAA